MRVRSLVAAVVFVLTMLPSFAAAQARPSDRRSYLSVEQRTLVQVDGFGIAYQRRPRWRAVGRQLTNEIYRWNNGGFHKLPGLARDIGVGGDGTAWIIGTDDGVYKWNGSDWDRMEGQGVAISVDRSGSPWVVNDVNGDLPVAGRSLRAAQRQGPRHRRGRRDVVIGTDNQIYRRGPTSGCRWAAAANASAPARTGQPGSSTSRARSGSGATAISTWCPAAMRWTSARTPRAGVDRRESQRRLARRIPETEIRTVTFGRGGSLDPPQSPSRCPTGCRGST